MTLNKRFFACLLFFLGAFSFSTSAVAEGLAKSYWGNLFYHGKKFGYFSYKLDKLEDGSGFRLEHIKYYYPTEDMPDAEIKDELDILVDNDLALIRLDIKKTDEAGVIDIEVKKEKALLTIDISRNSYTTHDAINLDGPVYPASILLELIVDRDLEEGTYVFNVFVEDFLEVVKEKITVVRKYEAEVAGEKRKFFEAKITNDSFTGLNRRFIIDESGKIVSGQNDQVDILVKSVPETEITKETLLPRPTLPIIGTDTQIFDPHKLQYLKAKGNSLLPISENLFYKSEAQKFTLMNNDYDILLEIREEISAEEYAEEAGDIKRYLSDSIYVETKNKRIRKLASSIVNPGDDALTKTTKISAWVNENVKPGPHVRGFYSASDVQKSKEGVCKEYAILFCSLARASGVPTKAVLGLAYRWGYFGYHMWNEIYHDGKWLPVDTTVDQVGSVGAGYVKFTDTDLSYKALTLFTNQLMSSARFNSFEILDYIGSRGISLKEMTQPPKPNLKVYPEPVLPVISPDDIVIENPILVGLTYFDVSELPDELKPLGTGLQRVFKRNLLNIRRFSVIRRPYEGNGNLFFKGEDELEKENDRLGVEHLLAGKISQDKADEKSLVIESFIYGKKAKIPLKKMKLKKDAFPKGSEAIVFEMAKKLGLIISDTERMQIEGLHLPDFDNFLLFSRGVHEMENIPAEGEAFFPLSWAYFYAVLKEDSNFSLAYRALGDFYSYASKGWSYYLYDIALQLDPYDVESYWFKYLSLIHSVGEAKDREIYDEAKIILEKALHVAPYYANAHLGLGSRYSHNEEHDRALEETLKAKRLSPKNPGVYLNLGVIYRDKKMFEDAIAAYQKCMELDERIEDAYTDLSYIYGQLGRTKEVIEISKKGLEHFPESALIYERLCKAFWEQWDTENVIHYANKALAADRKIWYAHHWLGVVYEDREEIDTAIREFQLELAVNPEHINTHAHLGHLFNNKKDNQKEAIYHYKKAVELGSTNGDVYNNLAWRSMEQNTDMDKVVGWAEKGVQLNPGHSGHFGTLGWAYYKNGRYDEALMAFKKMNQYNVAALDLLGMGLTYLKKDEKRRAVEAIERAFSKDPKLNEEKLYLQEKNFILSSSDVDIESIMENYAASSQ